MSDPIYVYLSGYGPGSEWSLDAWFLAKTMIENDKSLRERLVKLKSSTKGLRY